jgi:hypothetical protein
MTQNQPNAKYSSYMMTIILIVLVLSIVSLFAAVYAMSIPGSDLVAGFLVIIGLVALALSATLLYQTKSKAATMKLETPKVMTIIECKKCQTKTVREFQRGDYVFKQLDVCPKCLGEKQMITGIYKEIKEKEKTYTF